MKKLLSFAVGLLWSVVSSAQVVTFVSGQVLTAAQLNQSFSSVAALVGATFTGPVTIPGLTATGTIIFPTNSLSLSYLATQAANTVVANATGGVATPTAFAVPSCSTSASALNWTANTGFTCNVAVNAAQLGGATFSAPGAIGGTTPGSGAFTTLSASGAVSGAGFTTLLAPYAPLASPALTGTPTAPTAGAGTNTTQLATTAFTNTIFAAPPSLGSTTPANVSATTLSASGTVSGTGFSTYLASPPAIGTTAAAAGKFTTLQSTSTFTPSTTSGIVGTTLADSANAGSIGEFASNSTTGTAITSGVTVNATSISLTAGDWNCWGQALFLPVATTVVANIASGITTTSATLPSSPDATYLGTTLTTGTNGTTTLNPMIKRINISSTTTVFLVAEAGSVTVSTATVNGYIQCRRAR